jgi:hypothetical protein
VTAPKFAPAPRTAQKRIRVLVPVRPLDEPVRGDDLDLEQVVDGPAEPAREVAEAAAERQARHADFGDEAEGRREAVLLCRPIDAAEEASWLHGREPALGVDDD